MNPKRIWMQSVVLVGAAVLFFSNLALAEDTPRHSWEFGPELYSYTYKEYSIGVKNQGIMYGLKGSYTYHPDRFMLKLDTRGAFGRVDYSSSSTGSSDNIDDYVIEGRLLAGYDFFRSEDASVVYAAYAGLGYRYLNDGGGGTITTTGALGYDRESNYWYLPAGLQATTPLSEYWRLISTFEFDLLLRGKQESHLSTASPLYSDITNNQDTGYGLRGSFQFQKTGEKVDLSFEPFVRYWDIENSEVSTIRYSGVAIGYGLEPENTTVEAGVALSASF